MEFKIILIFLRIQGGVKDGAFVVGMKKVGFGLEVKVIRRDFCFFRFFEKWGLWRDFLVGFLFNYIFIIQFFSFFVFGDWLVV